MSEFSDWLALRMTLAGVTSQSQLATYLGTSPSVVNAWFKRGFVPSPSMCYRLSGVLHVDATEVLKAAGHLAGVNDNDSPDLPTWLIRLLPALRSLDDEEVETVEVTIQTLLERRRRRAEAAAQAPPDPGSEQASAPAPQERKPRRR